MSAHLGIDIGTSSLRAVLLDASNNVLSCSTAPLNQAQSTHQQTLDLEHVWTSLVNCVNTIVKSSRGYNIATIDICATCSTVVDYMDPSPVRSRGYVILWHDQTASAQTAQINRDAQTNSIMRRIGGCTDTEMMLPRILQLQQSNPPTILIHNLSDWLVYKLTNKNLTNSVSAFYNGWDPVTGWPKEYYKRIGISSLIDAFCHPVAQAGSFAGPLRASCAEILGISTSPNVSVGTIDGFAGWLGMLKYMPLHSMNESLVCVSGTSTCFYLALDDPDRVDSIQATTGFWGPFPSIIHPTDLVFYEAGQNATGSLIEYNCTNHVGWPALQKLVTDNRSPWEILEDISDLLRCEDKSPMSWVQFVHRNRLLGNRTPIGDSRTSGAILGLTMDNKGLRSDLSPILSQQESIQLSRLCQLFVATIEGLCLQTRQIIQQLRSAGHSIRSLQLCGGQADNRIYQQLLSAITNLNVYIPKQGSSVVVNGAALLSRIGENGIDACRSSSDLIKVKASNTLQSDKDIVESRYAAFLDIVDLQKRILIHQVKPSSSWRKGAACRVNKRKRQLNYAKPMSEEGIGNTNDSDIKADEQTPLLCHRSPLCKGKQARDSTRIISIDEGYGSGESVVDDSDHHDPELVQKSAQSETANSGPRNDPVQTMLNIAYILRFISIPQHVLQETDDLRRGVYFVLDEAIRLVSQHRHNCRSTPDPGVPDWGV